MQVFVVEPISRFLFTVLSNKSKVFIDSFGSCTEYNLLEINTSTFGRKTLFGFSPRSFVFRLEQWSAPSNYMRQASCMKPEAQVPSEGSLFQSSCLPSLCVACPHNSRDWGGRGEDFFFSASSQVQLEAADGPGSRPYCLSYSDPHSCRQGSLTASQPPLESGQVIASGSLKKWAKTCHVSTESFSPAQTAAGFFFKKPFISVGYNSALLVHIF